MKVHGWKHENQSMPPSKYILKRNNSLSDGISVSAFKSNIRSPNSKSPVPMSDTGDSSVRRRLPTLPLLRSTIGVTGLNFSVRNGKRWNPGAVVTWIRQTWCGKSKAQLIEYWQLNRLNVYTCHTGKAKSERAISNARLWHRCLYTCILSTSSSMTTLRNLILWLASYLDAFSTYPIPT